MKSKQSAQKYKTSSNGKKLRLGTSYASSATVSDTHAAECDDSEAKSSQTLNPELSSFDLSTKCPTLHAFAASDGVHLGAEELDSVQFELEKLLYHAIVRKRYLSEALGDLNSSKPGAGSSPNASKKQAQSTDSGSNKKGGKRRLLDGVKRSLSSASLNSLKIKPAKKHKPDHVTISERSANSPGSSRMLLWPQNQMPFKFIDFVDGFAGPLTNSDISTLKSLIIDSDHSKSSSYHCSYSKKDINQSSTKLGKRMKNGASSAASSLKKTAKNLMNKQSKAEASNKNIDQAQLHGLGPLTEHLIQALIEENPFLCPSRANDDSHQPKFDKSNAAAPIDKVGSAAKSLLKSLNMCNLNSLEQLIKKELVDLELIDRPNDVDLSRVENGIKAEDDDEVTSELKQRQRELASVQCANFTKLSNLMKLAEKRLEKQELEKRLQQADDEIRELCFKFYGVPPIMKRPSSKKEKDLLWKALSNRNSILNQLSE